MQKGAKKKPTNKDRDQMIGYLNGSVKQIQATIMSLAQYINSYIDMNNDRDSLKTYIAKQQKEHKPTRTADEAVAKSDESKD
jgi:hypothetical protein